MLSLLSTTGQCDLQVSGSVVWLLLLGLLIIFPSDIFVFLQGRCSLEVRIVAEFGYVLYYFMDSMS